MKSARETLPASDTVVVPPARSAQLVASRDGMLNAPPLVDAVLGGASQSLPRAAQMQMEAGFGQDFSQVRLHTGTAAAESARAVGAAAYTVGNHVVFGASQFAPATPGGQRLLAHELAHVVQQHGYAHAAGSPLRIGSASDHREKAADGQAAAVIANRPTPRAAGAPARGLLQRSPAGADLATDLSGANLPMASVEVNPGESLSSENPKIATVVQSWKANAPRRMRVRVSAYLPSAVQNNSADEKIERGKLGGRMQEVRAALVGMGIPAADIDLSPATAYATSAHGQVLVEVTRLQAANPLFTLPGLPPSGDLVRIPPAAGGLGGLSGKPATSPKAGSGLPSLDLDLKFGPVTVSLPKEVRAKLPIALGGAKSLVIDLAYEVPAKFSLKITLDGTPYVRVSLKAGAEVDTKSGATTASAGLVIETTATTLNAVDPGETRAKIKKAGDALNKAMRELSAAKPEEKFEKAIDVASAIGDIYEAVDKASKSAKPAPRATLEFGYKRLLTPGDETDPRKQPPLDYAGVTATFRY